jgi:hypothetical protein
MTTLQKRGRHKKIKSKDEIRIWTSSALSDAYSSNQYNSLARRHMIDKSRLLEWDIMVHINDVTRSSQKSKDEGEDSLEMENEA